MPRAGQQHVVSEDLPSLITAFERSRATASEMSPWDWGYEAEFAAGAALERRIVATRAISVVGIAWKLDELIALLEAQDGPEHPLALARSVRVDLVGLAAATASMWGVPPAPKPTTAEPPPRGGAGERMSFSFDGIPIRVVMKDGEPWFVAVDVCRALGIKNSRDAVGTLDADEKGVGLTDTPGGLQSLSAISESGLYTLILRCRDAVKPGTVAHRFRKWVTAEVLPVLRRGGVVPPSAAEPPAEPPPVPVCPLLAAKPYMPRAISLTPEQAADRAAKAASKRRRRAEKRAMVRGA
jgi:prophage antirepressor-like protein